MQFRRAVAPLLIIGLGATQLGAAEAFLKPDWDDNPPARTGAHAGFAKIVAEASPSVVAVLIQSRARSNSRGSEQLIFSEVEADAVGSGVILSADGYIVTSSHVIEGATAISVMIPGSEEAQEATVVGIDQVTDIAVIKVDAKDLRAAKLARSTHLKVGDIVLTIGNPFGLDHTVTSGIVSGLGRTNLSGNVFENYIQTDAQINPGSSGGALIDNRGRVVGITGAMVSDDGHNAGIGFAEPIESAIEIVTSLISDGMIQRGYIGIKFADLTPALAQVFGLATTDGALVGDVTPGSPAASAGVQPGDVIVRFGALPITRPRELDLAVAACDPGSKHTVEGVRFGENFTTSIEVTQLPQKPSGGRREDSVPTGDDALPGVTLANLDAGSRVYFGVPAEIAGVIVIEVDPDSTAAVAGITEGDVILQIGRESIASLGQAVAAREKIEGEKILLRVLGWEGIKFAILESQKKE